jgi:Family of unknown function (DUF5522)
MPILPSKFAAATEAKALPGEAGPSLHQLGPEDFYHEGAAIVFTAAYHLKRGYCCKSECRHCPFRDGG